MKFQRAALGLFLLALVFRLLAALPQGQPNYMDEAYSYVNALNLAAGRGFVEDFVWNYLDEPAPPPHPSHLYWMPLTSILAWLGMVVGGPNYRAAQAPFILLAALLPVFGYWAAYHLTGRRWPAWLAGLLTIFSGFYLPYWTAIDNFTPFAVAGSLALILGSQGMANGEWRMANGETSNFHALQKSSPTSTPFRRAVQLPRPSEGQFILQYLYPLGAGVCAGLAHLARADGVLLLVAIWLVHVWGPGAGGWGGPGVRGWEPGVRGQGPGVRGWGSGGWGPGGWGGEGISFSRYVLRFTFYLSRFTFYAPSPSRLPADHGALVYPQLAGGGDAAAGGRDEDDLAADGPGPF